MELQPPGGLSSREPCTLVCLQELDGPFSGCAMHPAQWELSGSVKWRRTIALEHDLIVAVSLEVRPQRSH